MARNEFNIETLWREMDFKPTPHQKDAILHLDGLLYLPAGPGSGKTRVLLCRNCDARFSCDSYRHYATGSRARKEAAFKQYLDDYGTELDQQDWLSSELEAGLTSNAPA
jgi:hypothetical protein